MPKKPKPLSEQSKRFIEMAEKIGADATEEEFERQARRVIRPQHSRQAAASSSKKPK
jgi:hypothetical protein